MTHIGLKPVIAATTIIAIFFVKVITYNSTQSI